MADFTLKFENTGLVVRRPSDSLPDGAFSNLLNMTSYRDGYIENRLGSTIVSPGSLGAPIHSQGRLIPLNGIAINYQGAANKFYRNFVEVSDGYSGGPNVLSTYKIDTARDPHIIVFDSTKREKDDGNTVSPFGIAGPLAVVQAAAAFEQTKTIDAFEYPTNGDIQSAWTTSNATVTTDSTDPKQGTYSGKLTVAADTIGTMTRTVDLDLNEFLTDGDSDDDDYIHFWLKVDEPSRLVEVRILFDVDPSTNNFTKNFYWKSILPNEITAGVDQTVTARTAHEAVVTQLLGDVLPLDGDPRIDGTTYEEFVPGKGQWTEFFVKKSEFQRIGSHDNDWGDVAAVRVTVETNSLGTVAVNIDDGIMQGGTAERLNGDYDWIYRYRNQNTGTISPFSPLMESQVTVEKTKAVVTVANPRDLQVTHIDLFRRGGLLMSSYQFVKAVAVSYYGGSVNILDGIEDSELAEIADLTQVELSNVTTTNAAVSTAVFKTADSGANYTNYTAHAADTSGGTYVDLSSLDTADNGDWLLIAADGPFRKIFMSMGASVNSNTSTLIVEYWNGGEWVGVTNLTDGTSVVGDTLAQSGIIRFAFPEGWVSDTFNSVAAYYVRLRVTDALSAAVHVTEIRVGASEMDPTVFEIHADRCWVDDQQNLDRLWYSRRFKIEEFTDTGYIIVTQDAGPMVRPFKLDDQMFAFTKKTALRIIGSSEDSFQAIPTGAEVGLFGKYAICKGNGRIFYRGPGGIYTLSSSGFAEKISENLDPLFAGISVGSDTNLFPIDHDEVDSERLEFFNNKLYYAYQATNGIRFEWTYDDILKRWEQTDLKVHSYLRADDARAIYSGHADGSVYQREIEQTDNGAYISMDFRTKYIDFGTPDRDKFLTDVVIDCHLNSLNIACFMDINNGASSISAELTGVGRQLVRFPVPADTAVRNVAFRVTDTNTGNRIRFYGITFYYQPEPEDSRAVQTDWSDEGYPADKRFNQLTLEVDTADEDVAVVVEVDEVEVSSFTANTSGREKIINSLPADTIGRLVRVLLSGDSTFKYYGHAFDATKEPLAVTKAQTDWSDEGHPADKRFDQVSLEIDTGGEDVTVTVQIDGATVETFTANTDSRETLIQSLPTDTVGRVIRLLMSGTTAFKYYRHAYDFIKEPVAGTKKQTEWSDEGHPAEKRFGQLSVEIDTDGQDVEVSIEIDGTEVDSFTASTTTRQTVIRSMPADTFGRLVRLVMSGSTAFKYYRHTFDVVKEPVAVTRTQTEWSDEGYPADKRFNQLVLEIDTNGEDVTVTVQVDNATVDSFTANTSARSVVLRSLPADTMGKLVRVLMSGSVAFQYYRHQFEVTHEPLALTRYDTYELDFNYTRKKFIRRVWVAGQTPATVTLDIYIDEVLSHTTTFSVNPSSGWTKTKINLPPALKGMVFRFVFTSASAFKLYLDQSDVEWHPLAGDRGYDRARLARPAA